MEREHAGLRRITGYGVSITRGAASAMMFTFSCLLVTVCRNTITFLRETFLHMFIPFDAALEFHKYIAVLAALFTGRTDPIHHSSCKSFCRNLSTKINMTLLSTLFSPFSCLKPYLVMFAVTVVHLVGHAINFYHISTQTADDLSCLFPNYFHG